ncbi:ATP-binding protein [Streptomyces sp. NPDC021100]|uniref:ATP-binding protein n=1 Tax=Streptomyces sp. NPDC021100 TaxID=3365114 RepID=UPI0037B775F8
MPQSPTHRKFRDEHRGKAPSEAFSGWGQIFGDDVFATAVLDRFLRPCDVIAVNGPEYWLKSRLAVLWCRAGGCRAGLFGVDLRRAGGGV